MLPQLLQKAEYGTPVAALTLDGLLVTCFNRDTKEWEMAVVRVTHGLEIIVRTVELKTGKIVAQSPSGVPIREDAKLIKFKVSGGATNHFRDFERGYFFFKDRPQFNRAKEEDSIDYRWVVDAVSDVPNGKVVDVTKAKDTAITLMTVPNALFYTKRVTQDTVLFADSLNPATDPDKFVLGRSNELVGAAIYASQPGDIEMIYADSGESIIPGISMPFRKGFFYDISIMNRDLNPGAHGLSLGEFYPEGDFLEVYQLLKFDRDKKFQVFAAVAVNDINRNDEVDCHVTDVGSKSDTGLSLQPLIT